MAHTGAVLFAKDMERVAAFYEGVFAMPVVRRGADHVALAAGAFELIVHAIPAHIAATFTIATPPERREEASVKLCLPLANIAEARRVAARLGGVLDPADREWEFEDRRVCDGVDPEGNVVQGWQFPSR